MNQAGMRCQEDKGGAKQAINHDCQVHRNLALADRSD